jgi:hypothetical protein
MSVHGRYVLEVCCDAPGHSPGPRGGRDVLAFSGPTERAARAAARKAGWSFHNYDPRERRGARCRCPECTARVPT